MGDFLLIRLIVQGGLRLLKETSRPEVLWRGWPGLLRVGKPHPLWRLAQRNGVESQCQKYLCNAHAIYLYNAQDTNEGKQKVVNDYVVLLCGLIDKAGSRLLFPPEPLNCWSWYFLKALWENVPEQTLQEISDAIWGQVFLFFVNFCIMPLSKDIWAP